MKIYPVKDMKAERAVKLQLHSFLTSALDWGESDSLSDRFSSEDRSPVTQLNRRLFGPQSLSGYFGVEKNLMLFSVNEPRFVSSLYSSHYTE
jgi:hypothetical protein